MNTGLLTSMLAANTGARTSASRFAATSNTSRFAANSFDDPLTGNAPKPAAADNTSVIARDELVYKPPRAFRYALRRKITVEKPKKAHPDTKPESQGPAFSAAVKLNSPQFALAQGSPNAAPNKKETATEMPVNSGTSQKSPRLLADSKAYELLSVTKQTTVSAENKLFRGQTTLKTVSSNTSKDTLITETQHTKGGNADKTPKLNKTVTTTIPAHRHAYQQNGKELISEVPAGNSKTTLTSEKLAVAGTSTSSSRQKTSPSSGKESMPEALLDGTTKTAIADKKPLLVDKPAVSSSQKISAPILSLEKSALSTAAGEPTSTSDKIRTNQHHSGSTQGLSEPSDNNGKQSRRTGGGPLGESILKELNPDRVEVSTSQTKNHSGPAADNSSNSSFSQLFSHNNSQTPITENLEATAQAVKPAVNTSPNNTLPSISEQIQESIHSSLGRGEKQITIRLNPPELGEVFIKFKGQADQVTGILEVSKAQTRAEIQQALPQIVRNLADSGIQVKRLEVVLSDTSQSEQQALKDQSLTADQNGSFRQHASAERENPDNHSANESLTETNSYAGLTEPQQMLVTDSSINMLV